jgi:hypothetical protein
MSSSMRTLLCLTSGTRFLNRYVTVSLCLSRVAGCNKPLSPETALRMTRASSRLALRTLLMCFTYAHARALSLSAPAFTHSTETLLLSTHSPTHSRNTPRSTTQYTYTHIHTLSLSRTPPTHSPHFRSARTSSLPTLPPRQSPLTGVSFFLFFTLLHSTSWNRWWARMWAKCFVCSARPLGCGSLP